MSGTLKVTTLQDGASATANMVFDTSGNTTAGGTVAMASSFKRNRIINGNMLIDQRNAGASVATTAVATATYTLDRWGYQNSVASKYTVQQNAGSVTPPAGFTNYLGVTSSSAYSVGASDYFNIIQFIEGYNTADLGWGTANAKTVTLSFWVYSSLTGTFGGSLQNSAQNRSYPFSYTISSANTWTYITVTVAGDTSGTWVGATNGIGIRVWFGLGVGSTFSGTAGSWAAAAYASATGAVSVVGTNGATFYVTGVQLEVGSSATPYETQIYSDQLVQCQRYYQQSGMGYGYGFGTTLVSMNFAFITQMRASPTATLLNGTNSLIQMGGSSNTVTNIYGVYVTGTTLSGLNLQGTFSNGSSYAAAFTNILSFSAEL
jgi:hypothetical protein